MRNHYLAALYIGLFTTGLSVLVPRDSAVRTPGSTLAVPPAQPDSLSLRKPVPHKIAAPALTATNSYTLTNDQGLPGASAGDELEYNITISNSGSDAFHVIFQDVLDANTTLVPGSLKTTILAQDDSYQTIGNVGLDIPAGSGLLANDYSPDGSVLTITTATPVTTALGGRVTINAATGAFTYSPPVGVTGTDSFTYTLQNAANVTATANVTISLTGRIWFIKASSGASGADGTLEKPFTSLDAFRAVNDGVAPHPQSNDNIFIYAEPGPYTGSLTLLNGQKLIGQGASVPLLTLTGLTAPSGNSLLPATGGPAPLLNTATPNTHAITLASGNLVRGLDVGTTTGTKLRGNNFGTLTLREVALSGDGQALQLSNGTLDAEFTTLSSTTTGIGAIAVSGVTGTLKSPAGTIASTNATAISIAGASSAARVALDLDFLSVAASGAGKGITLSNTSGTFDITGNGATAGSGGTIANITGRGAEFIQATGITLRNMNFLNANTTDFGPVIDGNNQSAYAAIHAGNVTNLQLENLKISQTAQQGINLSGVSDFSLAGSTLENCGSGTTQEEGCLYATNLSGICTIAGSTLKQASGRAAYIRNNTGMLTRLTVDNSTFSDSPNGAGLMIEGYGAAILNVRVQNNCSFLRNQTQGIAVHANETANIHADVVSSTMDATNMPIAPNDIGTGINLAASGSAILKFNFINNSVKSRGSHAVNVFAAQDALAEGNIRANTITCREGAGAGIAVRSEGLTGNNAARTLVKIDNNTISGVTSDSGIKVHSLSKKTSRSDVTITGNTVGLNPAAPPTSLYNIEVSAVASPVPNYNNSKLCAAVSNNQIPAGNGGELGFGYARSAMPASGPDPGTEILLQGAGTTFQQVWNANGNTTGGSVINSGTGLFTYNASCAAPNVPELGNVAREAVARTQAAPSETGLQTRAASPGTPQPAGQQSGAAKTKAGNTPVKGTKAALPANSRAAAGETVRIAGNDDNGFTLPSGKNITITFRATINNDIPASVCEVTNQGTITGDDFTQVLTDDPAQPGAQDPTVTPVVSEPVITSCPPDENLSTSGDNCTMEKTYEAVAAGCPAPVVTYRVNGTPISFPYAFPEGTTTVEVTASNGIGTDAVCSFSVHVSCVPMPVKLASFTVSREKQTALLHWKTTSESNSDRFVIQRGTDGKNWKDIGVVPAKGESEIPVTYSFTDATPVMESMGATQNYYRLKIVDRDETFEYSPIERLRFETIAEAFLFPNPVSEELHLRPRNWKAVKTVELLNLKGQTVYRSASQSPVPIRVRELPAGTYMVQVRYLNGTQEVYKVEIVH